jgi:hypothetical protein
LQRRRLFLRNRRVVCGYELLDRTLRERIGSEDPDAVPPTWLTVGKWTALGIGDLLEGRLALPARARWVHRAIWLAVSVVSRSRAIPMGRILVMGNREIFAQVASVLTAFLDLKFEHGYNDDFLTFAARREEESSRVVDGVSYMITRRPSRERCLVSSSVSSCGSSW